MKSPILPRIVTAFRFRWCGSSTYLRRFNLTEKSAIVRCIKSPTCRCVGEFQIFLKRRLFWR